MGLGILLLPLPAAAQSPFDGTWKIDLASIKRQPRPDVIAIVGGHFGCTSCEPRFRVPADGAFHPVAGQDEFDAVAVRIVDAATIERTNRLKGRTVRVETRRLSTDGRGATMRFTDTINPGVPPVSGTQSLVRLSPLPSNAHALSGSWQHQVASDVSDNALTQTFRTEGDLLTLETGEGFSYTARLDGTPAPARGDPMVDSVSVRRVGTRELHEVDSAKGRVLVRFTTIVSPDGRTMTITSRNEKSGKTTVMTARRQ